MKKVIIVMSVLLIAVLVVGFSVSGGNQDKKKINKAASVEVQKTEKCSHEGCSADCLGASTKEESKCSCSADSKENHAKGECAGIKSGSVECKAKHEKGECIGHKPGECQKKK